MSGPEDAVVRAARTAISRLGGDCVKTRPGGGWPGGTPDIVACVGGRLVMIECKAPTGGLRASQIVQLRRWAAAGAVCIVLWGGREADLEDQIRIMTTAHLATFWGSTLLMKPGGDDAWLEQL